MGRSINTLRGYYLGTLQGGSGRRFLVLVQIPKGTNKSIGTKSTRAGVAGIGRFTQHKLDRLARDFPTLHKRVRAGVLSVHAAATVITSGAPIGWRSCPGWGRFARHRAPQRVLGVPCHGRCR